MEKDKKSYEIGFMAENEKGIHELVERVKAHGGEVTLEGSVEEIALAYQIKKHSKALFGHLHIAMDPGEAPALSGELERVAEVLRFLIVTPPFIKPKPRQMFQEGSRTGAKSQPSTERKQPEPAHLSNEALEKKIEEILQEA